MLKILHSRFHQDVNSELPDVSGGFQRGRGTRDQIPNICWITGERKGIPEKNIYFFFIEYAKASDCVDHKKLENP